MTAMIIINKNIKDRQSISIHYKISSKYSLRTAYVSSDSRNMKTPKSYPKIKLLIIQN